MGEIKKGYDLAKDGELYQTLDKNGRLVNVRKSTKEKRQKLRDSHLGMKLTDETKKKLSNIAKENRGIKTKLDIELVREIKNKNLTGEYTRKELAELYNVSHSTITKIINNVRWGDVV